jgi:hypothetical protein
MGQSGEMGRSGRAGGALPPGKRSRRPHFAALTHPQGGLVSPVGALGALARYLEVSGLRCLAPHGADKAVPNAVLIEFRPWEI